MDTEVFAIIEGVGYRYAPALFAPAGGVTQEELAPMPSHNNRSRAENLAGQRFGRLVVLDRVPMRPGVAYWRCVCDCGNEHTAKAGHLKDGNVQSCGCLVRERVSLAKRTHQRIKTKEYYAWAAMKQRCQNPKNKMWHYYGGRGIGVCDRWDRSFETFLKDMGEAPPHSSLDRIDNDKGYDPGNCRWTDSKTQGQNKRNNRYLTARGETHIMAEWARIAGVRRGTIANRLRAGWTEEEAIFGKS